MKTQYVVWLSIFAIGISSCSAQQHSGGSPIAALKSIFAPKAKHQPTPQAPAAASNLAQQAAPAAPPKQPFLAKLKSVFAPKNKQAAAPAVRNPAQNIVPEAPKQPFLAKLQSMFAPKHKSAATPPVPAVSNPAQNTAPEAPKQPFLAKLQSMFAPKNKQSVTPQTPAAATPSKTPISPPVKSNALCKRFIQKCNEFRRSEGKPDLAEHAGLNQMALEHAGYMNQKRGTFGLFQGKSISHTGFMDRASYAREHYNLSLGENIAAIPVSKGEDPATKLLEAWKNSKHHREALLSDWTSTGIGVVKANDGMYFADQLFGK